MRIEVVDYMPIWDEKYSQEEKQIKVIFGKLLINIYHIGSTAVKGLKSKPIIDIIPIVLDIKKVDEYNFKFEALGYECMGEFGRVR